MALVDQTPVMDVLPWPHGYGFQGSSIWWDYLLSKEERKRLDSLMGLALLDEGVCKRLLDDRDDSLLEAFGLSEETRNRIRAIRASSLVELAQAIALQPPYEPCSV